MKRIILTGASDGLGESIGKLFLSKGYEIIAVCRTKPSYECKFIKTDLSVEESVLSACKTIEKNYSNFDALINCAGVISLQEASKISYSDVKYLFMVNTISPIIMTSTLLNLIKNNRADVLNVSSIAGTLFDFERDSIAYASSKWALRGASYNLSHELENTECRVINLNVCGMKTKLLEKYNKNLKGFSDLWVETEEVANIVYFMLNVPKTIQFTDVSLTRKSSQ